MGFRETTPTPVAANAGAADNDWTYSTYSHDLVVYRASSAIVNFSATPAVDITTAQEMGRLGELLLKYAAGKGVNVTENAPNDHQMAYGSRSYWEARYAAGSAIGHTEEQASAFCVIAAPSIAR